MAQKLRSQKASEKRKTPTACRRYSKRLALRLSVITQRAARSSAAKYYAKLLCEITPLTMHHIRQLEY
ncbi:MAG: hypothetical protein ACRC8W_11120, partial [Plesiomonas shigelloides]